MAPAATALATAGSLALLYGIAEAHSYCVRRVVVPCVRRPKSTLRVLHVSDLHLTPWRRHERSWVAGLAHLNPDLVVATGDLIGHPRAVASVAAALAPLLHVQGAFVFGSNDYYRSGVKNPLMYLAGPSRLAKKRAPDLPWSELATVLRDAGWHELLNASSRAEVRGLRIEMRGVDDPHVERDDYDSVAGPFDPDADLRLCVTHSPYRRVLNAMAADGADLILAGHTHGGQVRIPGCGALVTNCDLPARYARGLHRYSDSWLHVSAGIGTSPYAPFRIACRPEVTLLTLTPAGTESVS